MHAPILDLLIEACGSITVTLMPFDFLKLIWTALIGAWFFAKIPDISTWIGASVIFASGLFIAFREHQANTAT